MLILLFVIFPIFLFNIPKLTVIIYYSSCMSQERDSELRERSINHEQEQ